MKNLYFLSTVFLIFLQCNTYRNAEKQLVLGNFDETLDRMITKKSNGVNPKKYDNWVYLLQQAYDKANEDDLSTIARYSKDVESIKKYRIIYDRHCDLINRQNKIKALLPIYHNNKIVRFNLENYNEALAQSKENLANALARDADLKMKSNNKNQARQAYYRYKEIQDLMPQYKNINQLKSNAYNQGLSHVKVSINNYSGAYLPAHLSDALLDDSFVRDNKFWYQFYFDSNSNINYDYEVSLNFNNISVSPEQSFTSFHEFKKRIEDGEKPLLNQDGSKQLDSLGQPIMVKKYKNITAQSQELRLYKASTINAFVLIKNYNDVKVNKPLANTFIFEDFSANIMGDYRALPDDYTRNYKKYPSIFPSSEQMIFDNGIQLKIQLKNIIDHYFS